jgi:hypothetical protein
MPALRIQVTRHVPAAIFDSYSKTSMANASGPASAGLIPGKYHHAPSGIDYTVAFDNAIPTLTYDRPGAPLLRGSTPLSYYIGSGKRGRTYLHATDGYWFQAPINW